MQYVENQIHEIAWVLSYIRILNAYPYIPINTVKNSILANSAQCVWNRFIMIVNTYRCTYLQCTAVLNLISVVGVLVTRVLPQEGRNITSSEDPQVLILTNVTERDAGWYTCIAANSLGTSFSTAYLSVTDGELAWFLPLC